MNKTLKEQFLKDIKQGTMIDVTFVTYQKETFINRYVYASNTFFSITDNSDATSFIDLKDVDDADLGLKGSPTKIAKASDKVRKGAGEKVVLDTDEAVAYLIGKFKEKHII